MNKKTVIVLGYKKLGKILNDRLALLSNMKDIEIVILTGTKVETLYMRNYIDNVLKLQIKVIIDDNSYNTFQNMFLLFFQFQLHLLLFDIHIL